MTKQCFNPFLPSYEYIPDAEPHVFGNRVYIYGSHDKFNGRFFCMNDYVCGKFVITNVNDIVAEVVVRGSGKFTAPLTISDGTYPLFFTYRGKGRCNMTAIELV